MIRNLLAAAALFIVPTLQAAPLLIPKAEPIASITFPDKWKVEVEDEGVEAQSPDEEVYVIIETHEAKDIAEAVAATLVALKEHSVTLDKATEKKQEASANGLDMINYQWTGAVEGEQCKVSLSVLSGEKKEKVLLMLFWGTPDGEKNNAKDLQAIVDSMKAAGK